jgi:hypothetical protein
MKNKVKTKQKMTKEQEKFLKEVDKLISNLKETGHYWEDEDFAFQFPKKRFDDGSNYEYGHIHIWDNICPKSLQDDDERPSPVLHIYIQEDSWEESGYSFCYYINDTITYDEGYHHPCGISKFTKTMLKEMIVELNTFAKTQYKNYIKQYA